MANKRVRISDEQRPLLGQSFPLGDTGSGQTGVPAGEQGISNRPGDHAVELAEDEDEDDEDDEDLEDEDEAEDAAAEDLDEDDDEDDDDEEDEDDGGDDDTLEDEEDETTDVV